MFTHSFTHLCGSRPMWSLAAATWRRHCCWSCNAFFQLAGSSLPSIIRSFLMTPFQWSLGQQVLFLQDSLQHLPDEAVVRHSDNMTFVFNTRKLQCQFDPNHIRWIKSNDNLQIKFLGCKICYNCEWFWRSLANKQCKPIVKCHD